MSPTRKNNRIILPPLSSSIINAHREQLKQLNKTTSSRSKRKNSQSRKLSSSIKLTREQKTQLKEVMKDSKFDNKLNIKVLRKPTQEEQIEIIKKNAEQNPNLPRKIRKIEKKYNNNLSSHR